MTWYLLFVWLPTSAALIGYGYWTLRPTAKTGRHRGAGRMSWRAEWRLHRQTFRSRGNAVDFASLMRAVRQTDDDLRHYDKSAGFGRYPHLRAVALGVATERRIAEMVKVPAVRLDLEQLIRSVEFHDGLERRHRPPIRVVDVTDEAYAELAGAW